MPPATYSARETERIQVLHGRELASFGRRAAALAVDFLLAGVLFMLLVYPAALTLVKVGTWTPEGDVTLRLNFFKNWYSVIWLVGYIGLATYLGTRMLTAVTGALLVGCGPKAQAEPIARKFGGR